MIASRQSFKLLYDKSHSHDARQTELAPVERNAQVARTAPAEEQRFPAEQEAPMAKVRFGLAAGLQLLVWRRTVLG